MTTIHDVVIIGSGPAGWTAALYTARANLKPIVYEGSPPNTPGGQLMQTSEVENFPGFPHGILGSELMDKMREQASRFGLTIKNENIVAVDFSHDVHTLTSESGEVVQAKTVIIATGATAKLLGLPREKELMAAGAGVSACATCDGAFYKDVEVVVVGGGDTAMEEALFLTRFASKVTIVHRRDEFRASKIMVDRAKANPKIEWALHAVVDEIQTETQGPFKRDNVVAVVLKDVRSGDKKRLSVGGVFVAIGHEPNTSLFKNILTADDKGYLVTKAKSTQTNVLGVFACGDVQDSVYRQAITAAGTGCMAAIEAERYLESIGH